METIYRAAEEHQLVQGTLLTTLPTLGKEWRVTHDFKPTRYLNHYANSLHLTIGGEYGQYGDRTPAIWPSTPEDGFHTTSAVNGMKSYPRDFDRPPVGAWTTIAMSQTLEGGKYVYRVTMGGQEVHAVENRVPAEFQDVKVYASNPWYAAQPGSIRNLEIETRVQVRLTLLITNSLNPGLTVPSSPSCPWLHSSEPPTT